MSKCKCLSKDEIDIQDMVENRYCPYPMFCTVATTVYSKEERVETCTQCWKNFLTLSEQEVLLI